MWDKKRQIIWLATGVVCGTFFIWPLAYDDAQLFDCQLFAQLEALLLLIITVMFYIYSRKQ